MHVIFYKSPLSSASLVPPINGGHHVLSRPAKFRQKDSGGDGDVETLRRLSVLRVGRNTKRVGDKRPHGLRDTIALIAHDDDGEFRIQI